MRKTLAISKERKQALVAQYEALLKESNGMVLTGFSGLTVREMEGLRRRIREVGGEFHVVKNTLAKLAFERAGLEMPEEMLEGTTAIGFASDDIPGVARAIVELARQVDTVGIKGGYIEGIFYSADQMERLADLPPLPVLRGQLLGVIQAPATKVAGLLAASVRQVVNVVKAYSETEAPAAGAA